MSDNQNPMPGPSGAMTAAQYAQMAPPSGVSGTTYNPPPRYVIRQQGARYVNGRLVGGTGRGIGEMYTGPGLVDENNFIALPGPYQITDQEVRRIYGSMSPEYRAKVMETLRRKGIYVGSSNFQNDLDAIAGWLDFSNTMGVTRSRALNEMERQIPDTRGGGGGGSVRRYRTSNPDDVKAALNKAALDTLGRAFTEQELALAVPGFQKAEVQSQQQYYSQGTSAEAPSAQAFGEATAQFFDPNQANAYKFLGIMNRIFSATGGM